MENLKTYDDKGRLVSETQGIYITSYSYDDKNRVILKKEEEKKPSSIIGYLEPADWPRIKSVKEFAYDSQGKCIFESYSSNGNTGEGGSWGKSSKFYWRDSAGTLVAETSLNSHGYFYSTCEKRYNNRIKFDGYGENRKLISYDISADDNIRCSYNSQGLLSEINFHNGFRIKTFKYDYMGRIIAILCTGAASKKYDSPNYRFEYQDNDILAIEKTSKKETHWMTSEYRTIPEGYCGWEDKYKTNEELNKMFYGNSRFEDKRYFYRIKEINLV